MIFLVELFHLLYMYFMILLPFVTSNRLYLLGWIILALITNITWFIYNDKCILTKLEVYFRKKEKRDTLTKKYALLTQQEKKIVIRVLLLFVLLKLKF